MNQAKRYSAEEMCEMVCMLKASDNRHLNVASEMLAQSLQNESKVMELVDAMEEIVRETVAFGVNDYASRCAALRIAKSALSKFRGD